MSSEFTELSVRCGSPSDWEKAAQNISLQETTVGPEWSQELTGTPSLSNIDEESDHGHFHDHLASATSLIDSEGIPMDALDREMHSHHNHALSCSCRQCTGGQVVHRSPVVSVVEIPRRSHEELSQACARRVIHVAAPPHHDCLAFDRAEQERKRRQRAAGVSQLMRPGTKKLLEGIRDAGPFPKRCLVKSSPSIISVGHGRGDSRALAAVQPAQAAQGYAGRALNLQQSPSPSLPEEEELTGLKAFFPASARSA